MRWPAELEMRHNSKSCHLWRRWSTRLCNIHLSSENKSHDYIVGWVKNWAKTINTHIPSTDNTKPGLVANTRHSDPMTSFLHPNIVCLRTAFVCILSSADCATSCSCPLTSSSTLLTWPSILTPRVGGEGVPQQRVWWRRVKKWGESCLHPCTRRHF